MKRTDPFPEIAAIDETIRSGLSGVYSLAPRQVDGVFAPLPPGTDYLPSHLFLLASLSCGISSGSALTFACALRSFDLAFRGLLPLVDANRMETDPRSDHEHEEGMALLVTDGLILMAHGFLTDLYSTDFDSLVPILVKRPREWIGQLESAPVGIEENAAVQRSMAETAVEAVRELTGGREDRMRWIESVSSEADRLLGAYRMAVDGEGRNSVIGEFDALSDSLREAGEGARPLARYVSLVSEPLTAISSL